MKSTRKERIGWYFYDWANSAFTTTVVTVFLGPFLTAVARNASDADGFVHLFGFYLRAGSFFPLIVALSVLIQALFLPFIGAFADYTSRKKLALGALTLLGSLSTVAIYLVKYDEYILCGALFVLANFAFGASCAIYNSILNDIAEEDERDKISSIGWGFGYIGGGVALAFNLALFMYAENLGISQWTATRINIASAGVWWGLFTIVTLSLLKNRFSENARLSIKAHMKGTFNSLLQTVKDVKNHKTTFQFLLAYIFYNDGVQAVISLSAQFGQEELQLPIEFLTQTILVVQFAAFFGAMIFNKVANKIGARRTILFCLMIWTGAVIYSYAFLHDATGFFFLAMSIALVMGGTQALSRSIFSKLIPKGSESQYFSVYELSERGTSWIGPLIFGLTYNISGSYRYAILSLLVLFIVGGVLLSRSNYNLKKKL